MRPRRRSTPQALGAFIARQYADAKVDPDEIDTGALILTGVAVRRRNARAIGELFAREAGKLVAVSAGDSLETVMAAYGSGAVARSIRDDATVMNVDVGGGTSKIAVCGDGKVVDVTALDVGARLVCVDADGRIVRIEEAGRRFAAELGIAARARQRCSTGACTRARGAHGGSPVRGDATAARRGGGAGLLRLDPLPGAAPIDALTFSGGVSEYIYGRETRSFGDLGLMLGARDPRRAPSGCGVRAGAPRRRASAPP